MGSPVRMVGNYVDGRPTDDGATEYLDRFAPGTNELVSRVVANDEDSAQGAIVAARKAFDEGPWPRLAATERAVFLNRLADLIEREADELARLDSEESGKPLVLARSDASAAAGICRYAAALGMASHGSIITNAGTDFTGLILREPAGVAGLIVPWNFPALILCQKLPFALAAGCTVVIKPSEFTSSSALVIARLATEAGIPDGVVNVVTGAGAAGRALSASPLVDVLSFTGSTATGKAVAREAAGTLKRVTLELGGKAAAVVFDDADFDDAVAGVAFGMNFNNGECCVAQPRLLIQEGIAADFLGALTQEIKRYKVGQPLDITTDVGPLIHGDHLRKVEAYVNDAVNSGADLVTGGKRLTGGEFGQGQFYAPTVLDRIGPSDVAFQEEIFGPVLTATRFKGFAEAVELANNVNYGLSNSVWSKDVDKVLNMAKQLQSGNVYANTTIDDLQQMPFGGYKASGDGRVMGEAGYDEFTRLKSVKMRTGPRVGRFVLPGAH